MKLDYNQANEESTIAAYRAFLSKFSFKYIVSTSWYTDLSDARMLLYRLEPSGTALFDGEVDLNFFSEYE